MSQHRHISQELLQDPCLRRRSYSILIIRFCGPAQAKRKFWAPETRFVWPCAGKTVRPRSAGAFRAGETQILSSGDAFCVALRRENNCRDAFFVALRRRNANFDLQRCIFCGPAQAKRKFWLPETHLLSRWSGLTRSQNRMNKIATALQRDAKKNLTSGVAFSGALRSETRADRKKTPRPKRLYPYRKNPSVCHTVWGKRFYLQSTIFTEKICQEGSTSTFQAHKVDRVTIPKDQAHGRQTFTDLQQQTLHLDMEKANNKRNGTI